MLSVIIHLLGVQSQYVDVAILHSQTGTLAISEITVINAEILAIEELNAAGGVLGNQIRYTVFDGQSSPAVFAHNADIITSNTSFVTTFGCWTSSSRKAVLPYYEGRNQQLWYPVQYEGQECSKNVFYSGADPNEQIEPSLVWLLSNYPKNVYLIGSDYVFPRTANSIIKSMLHALGATLIGEDYIPLPANAAQSASNNVSLNAFLDTLLVAAPEGCIIYNTLNGDANVQLFQWMALKNMTADKYPSMSVSITEAEAPAIGIQNLVGHFAAWNYFMTDPNMTPITYTDYLSTNFIKNYRNRFGNTSVVNDPMEAAYINVMVWAQAVEQAESFDVDLVRNAAYGISFDAPEGIVTLQANHHFSKYARIGRFRPDGLFDIVYYGSSPVVPNPWSQYITASAGKACDWTKNRTDANEFAPAQVKVGLLYNSNNIELYKAQQLAIERLNYVGVLGKISEPADPHADSKE
ncbi:hypothetical protein HDV06_005899 [Boothiomyces sp. JEL0866]|nr:hypothetical protein HDV06_000448 [Boothiomyces sp. JEL0866]KAJ3319778.1 hypothetical protein HDV06_005899 [Boothiomyces sp. JEL0866]